MSQEIADKIILRDEELIEVRITLIADMMLHMKSVMDPRWDKAVKIYNRECLRLCRMTGEMSRANYDLF